MPGIMPNQCSHNDEQLVLCSHGNYSPGHRKTHLTVIIHQIVQVETACSGAKEFREDVIIKNLKEAGKLETSGKK